MSEPQIHFEIHGLRANSWAIQKVCDDKATAVDAAKGLYRDLDLRAIKVLKVSFDESDPNFKDKEIYYDGERVSLSSAALQDLIEPICQKAEDMYLPDARRAISRLLEKPLGGWRITPLELLYHQGNLQKLNDTGQILQGAVQKAAISQIQKTGQKVNERVLELYAITNSILQNLKITTKEEEIPVIEDDDLIAALNAAKENENWRRIFLMSMARHFYDIKTLDEKFEKIVEYLQYYDEPELLEMLDRYLSDFLSSRDRLQLILGEEDNLGDALLSLVDFVRGAKVPSPNMHPGAQRINMLLRDKKLPEVRATLAIRVRDTLMGNKSFAKSDPLKSMSYHKRLLTRLHISDGEYIGGPDAVEALQTRCERMTGSTTIAAFLGDVEHPIERIERLLLVNEGMIGAVNKRTIANYILPILENPTNVQFLIKEDVPSAVTFGRLKKLQNSIQKSGFQNYFSDKILTNLDMVGMEILTHRSVLESLKRDSGGLIQLGLNLLQLISADSLPGPTVVKTFRDFAKKIIVSEEFMKILEDKSSELGPTQTDFFRQFYALLEKTGIR